MKCLIKIFIFLLLIIEAKGQNVNFSQFYTSPFYFNPGFASTEGDLTFGLNHREKWRKVTPYTTDHVFGIYPLYEEINGLNMHIGGMGMNFYKNTAGQNGNYIINGGNLMSAFKVNLSSDRVHQMNLGLQIGFIQRKINNNKLRWGTQYDPLSPNGYNEEIDPKERNLVNETTIPEVGGGLVYSYNPDKENFAPKEIKKLYIGVSGLHLNQSDISMVTNANDENYPIAYNASIMSTFQIIENLDITTNLLYTFQNFNQQLNAGANFSFQFKKPQSKTIPSKLILGGGYRINNGVIGMAGLKNKYYELSFSYDYDTSPYQQISNGNGAMEIALKFYFHIIRRKFTSYSTPRM